MSEPISFVKKKVEIGQNGTKSEIGTKIEN